MPQNYCKKYFQVLFLLKIYILHIALRLTVSRGNCKFYNQGFISNVTNGKMKLIDSYFEDYQKKTKLFHNRCSALLIQITPFYLCLNALLSLSSVCLGSRFNHQKEGLKVMSQVLFPIKLMMLYFILMLSSKFGSQYLFIKIPVIILNMAAAKKLDFVLPHN